MIFQKGVAIQVNYIMGKGVLTGNELQPHNNSLQKSSGIPFFDDILPKEMSFYPQKTVKMFYLSILCGCHTMCDCHTIKSVPGV